MFIHEFTLIGQNAWSEVYLFSTIEEDLEGKRKFMIMTRALFRSSNANR